MTPTDGRDQRLSPGVAAALAASDHRIVVTGAGGWLGLATLELLDNALGAAFADRVVAYASRARDVTLRSGTVVALRPLVDIACLPPRPTLVLHLAFLTKDRVASMDEAAYREANAALSASVLAALDAIGATGVFVASSGAARSAGDAAATPAMRLYGELKTHDETLFADWAQQTGRTAVVTRIFNVAGPYINKPGHYALAAFVADALVARPIAVQAPHRVVRSFVAIRELMSLVLALLLGGPGIVRFDTGSDELELADLAAAVAAELGGSVARAPIVGDRIDRYVGDPGPYRMLLARHAIARVSLAEQIRDTAASGMPA